MRLLLLFLVALSAGGQTLPGFRIESVADVPGFVTSVVADSRGVVYCTTTDGWIHRVDGASSVPVAALPTHSGGNGGLLGMALLDDATAVVHYTTWSDNGERVLDDVISTVDLSTGAEHVLHAFAGDIELRERGVSDEHHGGNPTVASDGSIFVGIGEYGSYVIAQEPAWNGGKVWRLDREGNVEQFARGLRNPYDLAWDPDLQRLVVSDNGPKDGDEIHVIQAGDNCGWPQTFGNEPPLEGAVAPVYVFPSTVAPTGLVRLRGANAMLPHGYMSAAYVTRALYYFPDFAHAPIAVVHGFSEAIIDVTETMNGDILIATAGMAGSHIQHLRVPARGDCNGDGVTDYRDIVPTMNEIRDGDAHPRNTAQDGAYAGSWGCDANADNLIDASDLDALVGMLGSRRRSARH
jgi:glucose/arabinose dehydrogenase